MPNPSGIVEFDRTGPGAGIVPTIPMRASVAIDDPLRRHAFDQRVCTLPSPSSITPPCRSRADSPTVPGMIRIFQGIKPTIPKSCFIEETGIVIGDVMLGEHCSVWFHAVVRGDV